MPLRIDPGPEPLESAVKMPAAVFCTFTLEVWVAPVATLAITTESVPKAVRSGIRKSICPGET